MGICVVIIRTSNYRQFKANVFEYYGSISIYISMFPDLDDINML